jgi:membrane protein YqaA with SNARE-associated domain
MDEAWLQSLITALALPQYGLVTVFVVSLGSEFAVIGLVKLNPSLFWPAMAVATLGNTIGGATSWWTGYGAELLFERVRRKPLQMRVLGWLRHFGPKACLLSWLPVVGDPLCALAGLLKLPFWPCISYMAIGKLLRYIILTAALVWMFPGRFSL